LIGLLLPLLLMAEALGHQLTIGSNGSVYMPGQAIAVTGLVWNSGGEKLNLTVEVLVEDMGGRSAPSPLLQTIALEGGAKANITLMEATVDETYCNGLYRVSARLIDGRFVADQDELFFEIQGAPEDLSLKVFLCEDPECEEESLVFIKNERIYIGYACEVDGVSIQAEISNPAGSLSSVSLPYNFTAKLTGPYTLLLTASKAGYRDLTIARSFAVIDEEPDIAGTDKEPSQLHLATGGPRIAGDTAISLRGRVEPIHAEAEITMVCESEDGTAMSLTAVTDDEGEFWQRFQPEPTLMDRIRGLLGRGTKWSARATWEGDSNHLGSESEELDFEVENEIPLQLLAVAAALLLILLVIAIALRRRK
jgi:hypothetical protein